jgi:clumping factor A
VAAAQTGLNEPGLNEPGLNEPGLNEPDPNAPDRHRPDLGGGALSDEFAEADADDPDDEPLPQSVQPADAVRVARMDAEVLVVDGRPRYHLADCPHLVGRLTEPIPVNEAVELGFSPCGLCRPVDRLVAAEARR